MDELDNGRDPAAPFETGVEASGVPVLRLRGELDLATVGELDRAIEPILADRPRTLIVDVGEVSFADSSAIAKLVQWSHRVEELELRDASPLLRHVIDSMGLSTLLRLT